MNHRNPMRWRCYAEINGELKEVNGCFNQKKRPKTELFADCFKYGINFGDVDGEVERNGRCLRLEWKGATQPLPNGQRRSLKSFSLQAPGNLVIVVVGDAEAMRVWAVLFIYKGEVRPWMMCDFSVLHDCIARWFRWADKQPPWAGAPVELWPI